MRTITLVLSGLLLLAGCGAHAATSQPSGTATTAPVGQSWVQDTPEYDALLTCLFAAGYSEPVAAADTSDASKEQLVLNGKDVTTLVFKVDGSTITPYSGDDLATLKTAGCLT